MNYEGMGDNKINKLIVELMHDPSEPYCILHNGVWHKSIGHIIGRYPDGAFKFVNDERWWVPFPNYCNNPSDAWPIITENHINLSKHKEDDEWFAFTRADDLGVSEFQCKDKNALRAAMICFLKMKDAEK